MKFAICITNAEHDDLEKWKIYRVLPNAKADKAGCLRVIDESDEDYLYPADRFVMVEFSEDVQQQLVKSLKRLCHLGE
jgi:hypothetical protein